MALKLLENFYTYGEVGSGLAAANTTFNTQWIVRGNHPALISAGFKSASKTLTLSRTDSAASQVERRFTTDDDVVIVGYAFKATARNDVTFKVLNADDDEVVELAWPNQFQIGSDTGTATILLNTEYYVELKLEKSTKMATLKVNGYPYLTHTFTADATDTLQFLWGYNATGVGAADFVFGNVYLADGSAGKYQDFIGPQRINQRLNTEAVGDGWSPVPDDMTRLEIMQGLPPVAGQYTESSTVGDADLYKSDNEVDVGDTVIAVAVTTLVTKTDIDEQKIALTINDGVNEVLGEDISVPIQPAYFQQVFETNAEDADWDKDSVEGTSYGPVIRPRA